MEVDFSILADLEDGEAGIGDIGVEVLALAGEGLIVEGRVGTTGGADFDASRVSQLKSSHALTTSQRLVVESVLHANETARVYAVNPRLVVYHRAC